MEAGKEDSVACEEGVIKAIDRAAVIDGTKLVRSGFSPSTIGGPAKTVASINGTTIRPKR